MFGADYAKGPLIAGLSLFHSRGAGRVFRDLPGGPARRDRVHCRGPDRRDGLDGSRHSQQRASSPPTSSRPTREPTRRVDSDDNGDDGDDADVEADVAADVDTE